MDMSAEASASLITWKQRAWLSDYLVNAGEKSQDGFGVNDRIRIKILDDEKEGL
jgi:hypothetical protein